MYHVKKIQKYLASMAELCERYSVVMIGSPAWHLFHREATVSPTWKIAMGFWGGVP
jgi:hypothetical protein